VKFQLRFCAVLAASLRRTGAHPKQPVRCLWKRVKSMFLKYFTIDIDYE